MLILLGNIFCQDLDNVELVVLNVLLAPIMMSVHHVLMENTVLIVKEHALLLVALAPMIQAVQMHVLLGDQELFVILALLDITLHQHAQHAQVLAEGMDLAQVQLHALMGVIQDFMEQVVLQLVQRIVLEVVQVQLLVQGDVTQDFMELIALQLAQVVVELEVVQVHLLVQGHVMLVFMGQIAVQLA